MPLHELLWRCRVRLAAHPEVEHPPEPADLAARTLDVTRDIRQRRRWLWFLPDRKPTAGAGFTALEPAEAEREADLPRLAGGDLRNRPDHLYRRRRLGETVGRVMEKSGDDLTWSDRFDRIVTHRILGVLIFLFVMLTSAIHC